MAKNVVVTVDDYLMRKDPEKYKKLLESKEEVETVDVLTGAVDAYGEEKRELLAEIQELTKRVEAAESNFGTQVKVTKELEAKIKKLEAENKKLKKGK